MKQFFPALICNWLANIYSYGINLSIFAFSKTSPSDEAGIKILVSSEYNTNVPSSDVVTISLTDPCGTSNLNYIHKIELIGILLFENVQKGNF